MSLTQPAELPSRPTAVIPLSSIDPSPFNPRKEFDTTELTELAASILERGLLENLVVRPKPDNRYELMGGERRFRALQQLKAPDAKCNIIEADDAQAMAIQIVENLQRKDLSPMEEAEAFARLQAQDPKKWTAAEIGASVGKTDRFVSQRIAIATNLAAPMKERFVKGELTVESARTLAALPAAVQTQIPSWAIERDDADDIRRQALEICIPETAAKFNVALYKGDWIEGGKGKRFFADLPQFLELQRPAAEKKLEEVRKEWPSAVLVTDEDAGQLYYADESYVSGDYSTVRRQQREGDKPTRYLVPKEKCQTIVWIAANGTIRKAIGVCSAAAISKATTEREKQRQAAARRAPASKTTTATKIETESNGQKAARLEFNKKLAAALTKDPVARDRMLLLFMLSDDYPNPFDSPIDASALPKELHKHAGDLYDDVTIAAAWGTIAKMSAVAVRTAVCTMIVTSIEWSSFDWEKLPPAIAAVAASLGVTPAAPKPEPPKAKVEPKKAAPKAKAKPKKKAGK